MAIHRASIIWNRGTQAFTDNRYSRSHVWHFDGGITVPASSSDKVLPVPLSDTKAVDPEEALVVALSSCHMLFFLSYAARAGFVVDRYEDAATGALGKVEGRSCMTGVTLNPRVTFVGAQPDHEQFGHLHHAAHADCYLANSVSFDVACHPEIAG